MKVYMYMGVFSDANPDISLFTKKEDCMTFLNNEVDHFCKQFEMDKTEDVEVGLNSWHFETEEREATFTCREMEIL